MHEAYMKETRVTYSTMKIINNVFQNEIHGSLIMDNINIYIRWQYYGIEI